MASKVKPEVAKEICIIAREGMRLADIDVGNFEFFIRDPLRKAAKDIYFAGLLVSKERQKLYSRLIIKHCQEAASGTPE
jgi:hypothetical protein